MAMNSDQIRAALKEIGQSAPPIMVVTVSLSETESLVGYLRRVPKPLAEITELEPVASK